MQQRVSTRMTEDSSEPHGDTRLPFARGCYGSFMLRAVLVSTLLLGCGPTSDSKSKPAGTSADPVVTCERVGDVCKIDKSRLGVCAQAKSGSGFSCASQH